MNHNRPQPPVRGRYGVTTSARGRNAATASARTGRTSNLSVWARQALDAMARGRYGTTASARGRNGASASARGRNGASASVRTRQSSIMSIMSDVETPIEEQMIGDSAIIGGRADDAVGFPVYHIIGDGDSNVGDPQPQENIEHRDLVNVAVLQPDDFVGEQIFGLPVEAGGPQVNLIRGDGDAQAQDFFYDMEDSDDEEESDDSNEEDDTDEEHDLENLRRDVQNITLNLSEASSKLNHFMIEATQNSQKIKKLERQIDKNKKTNSELLSAIQDFFDRVRPYMTHRTVGTQTDGLDSAIVAEGVNTTEVDSTIDVLKTDESPKEFKQDNQEDDEDKKK